MTWYVVCTERGVFLPTARPLDTDTVFETCGSWSDASNVARQYRVGAAWSKRQSARAAA